jgi:phosphoribosylanthranilate isomerase
LTKIIVQIYEVQTPSEAEKLMALGVDTIGSVVVSRESWKVQSIKETIQVIDSGGARSSLIPLFSDHDAVRRTLDYYMPDIIHFCEDLALGKGNSGACENLLELQERVKTWFPEIKIMRSIPIGPPGVADRVPTLELARMFEPVSDYFLTDTLLINGSDASADDQPVKGFVGITGQTCDWGIAAKLVESSRIPVILAGGISPENVFDGVLQVRPAGVDSCTCTNRVDSEGCSIRFRKDFDKVERLLEQVRKAEQVLKKISRVKHPMRENP